MGPAVTISLGERWGASEGRRSGRGEGDGHGGCVGGGSERSRELEQERAPQPLTLAGAGSPSVIVGSKANGAREVSCSRSRWPKSACRGEQGRGHWSQTSTPGHAFPRTPRRLRWGLPIPVAPAWSGRLLRARLSLRPAPGSPAWQGLTSEPRTGLGPCSLSLGELHPDAGVLLLLGEESEGWGEGMAVRGHVAWRGWGGPFPSGWPQGRKEAARHPPPVPLDTHFSKVPLLQGRRRPSQQSWGAAPTRPLPSVWDTPRPTTHSSPGEGTPAWMGPDQKGQGLPPAHPAGPHRRGSLPAAAGGSAGHSPSGAGGSSSAPGTSWACNAASGWAQRLREHRRRSVCARPPGLCPSPSLPVLPEVGSPEKARVCGRGPLPSTLRRPQLPWGGPCWPVPAPVLRRGKCSGGSLGRLGTGGRKLLSMERAAPSVSKGSRVLWSERQGCFREAGVPRGPASPVWSAGIGAISRWQHWTTDPTSSPLVRQTSDPAGELGAGVQGLGAGQIQWEEAALGIRYLCAQGKTERRKPAWVCARHGQGGWRGTAGGRASGGARRDK